MHKFPPEHIARLENEARYKLLQPDALLKRFGVVPGMVVADIGAGSGFFSRAASRLVGTSGHVYAVDTSEEMLEHLKRKGTSPNTTVLKSEESRIPLDDAVADVVLLAFVLHEATHPHLFLEEVARIMKRTGTLLVVEWTKQVEEHGPPMEERLGISEAMKLLTGFRLTEFNSLNLSHYFVLGTKRIGR